MPAKSEHTVKLFEKAWNKGYNHNKITEQLRQKINGINKVWSEEKIILPDYLA